MKIALLDVRQGSNRDPKKSHTVAYRNLIALQNHFNCDLFVNASDLSKSHDYDVIICGFGSIATERHASTDFIVKNKNARIFWLVGDYEQSTFAPLFYSNREFEVIKNFEHNLKNKKCTRQHFVNFNTILNRPPRPSGAVKKYDCIYYGRWRPGRLEYFKKYLNDKIIVSTSSKNIKYFLHHDCKARFIKPLTWMDNRETLALFRASLYLEDAFTHNHYNCLGNRFYEALWCNTVPLFDSSCRGTLEKSGYIDYDWHIVKSNADITAKCQQIANGYTGNLAEWQSRAITEKDQVFGEIEKLIGFNNAK